LKASQPLVTVLSPDVTGPVPERLESDTRVPFSSGLLDVSGPARRRLRSRRD